MNWEGRSDRYFDPPDERFRTVERDPDQLYDDYQERKMGGFGEHLKEIDLHDQIVAMNAVAAQGVKTGVEIGKQESAARIKELESVLQEFEDLDDGDESFFWRPPVMRLMDKVRSILARSEKQAERGTGEV
jgi:hypothetical protein